MDLYDKIKEKNLKQNELIDELKYVRQVERGEITHEIKKESGREYHEEDQKRERGYYHLIDVKLAKIVCSGHAKRIHSYCRLRNIKKEQIKDTGTI